MRFIITSGATFEPWDNVRGITNLSKGTTGSKIAEEALLKGHTVEYIANSNTKKPFEIKINPNNINEVKKLKEVKEVYKNYTFHNSPTFNDYLNNCLSVSSKDPKNIFISSAAVSDYAPVMKNGKISSSKEQIQLEMKKLPKVIKEIKNKYPLMPIVGFKLLSSETSSLNDLIEVAYKSLLDLKLAMIVANLVDKNFKPITTIIITPEKNIIPIPERNQLASILVKTIEDRLCYQFYKTKIATPLANDIKTDDFFNLIESCDNYALFSPYGEGRKEADFGSIAMRTSEGMLTTGRGTTKTDIKNDSIALVNNIDGNLIEISSNKVKATLNAPTLWYILKERKEVNYIVHAHVYLPNGVYVEEQSAPGTYRDYRIIEKAIKSGANIINQVGHGCFILLKSTNDLLPLLKENGLYNSSYSKYYDQAYFRFKKGSLEKSVESLSLNKDSKVLDLACGTGKSALELLKLGFENLDIADGSEDMLKVAEKRINKKGVVASFEDLSSLKTTYDLITIRQAFTYLEKDKVLSFAKEINTKLNPKGFLVFNTFKELPEDIYSRYDEFEENGTLIKTKEKNIITKEKVIHAQRTEYLNSNTSEYIPLYDLNIFNQYDLEELRPLFESSGFVVEIRDMNKSLCFIARKV